LTAKVISLRGIQGGIQRDGTLFDSPKYVDGQWVRFQRGRPRKIGGYNGIFLNSPGIARGMIMQSSTGTNYLYAGTSNGLYGWQTSTTSGTGSGPVPITLSSDFSFSVNNLWQFDIAYDAYGSGALTLYGHPGQNIVNIDSTVNTPVLRGTFPYGSMSKVGVFTAVGNLSGTTMTISSTNYLIGVGQTVSGTGITAGTTVTAVTVVTTPLPVTTVTMSASMTTGSSITVTFDNNISVSGGCCMLYPYLFVYGNNGLIQNNSAGNTNNWVAADANTTNVSATKIVRGMALRGGTTSPAGLFWSLDQLTRVTYSPQTVGTSTIYWRYDIISSQTSIMSSQSIIEYDGIYYWCGIDRFLAYNGVVQEIPNDTNQNYFFDNINYAYRQKVFATKVPRWGEIWWFYPKGNSTECNDAIIYNVREKVWYDAGVANGSTRSSGVFSEVFTKPIWSDNTVRTNATFTASISGTTLTVTAVASGTLGIGQFITGTATTLTANTYITATISVLPTGIGTYTVSNTFSSAVASQTMTTAGYTLWEHEIGSDQIYLTNVNAVESYFETNSIGWNTGGPGNPQVVGDNKWIRVERIEPDFVQSGDMNIYITGKGYADDTDVTTGPYVFNPDTLKVDMREQRREMRIRFESNTFNGNYEMGNVLISADIGDERSTGNP
jgi:hypothetical protein